MFCEKCGQPYNNNIGCPNCNVNVYSAQKNNKNQLIVGTCLACCLLIVTVVYILLSNKNNSDVYFSDDNNINSSGNTTTPVEVTNDNNKKNGVTAIQYDNKYFLTTVTTESAILDKVEEDSESQKTSCAKEIIEIEKRISTNYQIDAVNLCELDTEFALELEKVIKYIYDEYTTARGYLMHISLGNYQGESTIAFFQWMALFTSSSKDDLMGYKSRIILNSSYYLNKSKFKQAVLNSVASGHFPKNASIYSPLAHEFAHYLSFIATNKYYNTEPRMILDPNDTTASYYLAILDFIRGDHSKRMCLEAYENYKLKTSTTISFDEFRGSISGYALAKDSAGNYIYDETIAEAFHDVYLNGENAKDASKEIVSVLRKYLEM